MPAFSVHFALQQPTWKSALGYVPMGALAVHVSYIFSRGLLTQTRNYAFMPHGLVVTTYLPYRVQRFNRAEITGYSRSYIRLRIGTFTQLTLHVGPQRSFTLPQFSYWNFKSLELALAEHHFPDITPTQA